MYMSKVHYSVLLFHMCVAFVPSSSSGAIRLAANFSTAPTRFVDPSTASFTNFIGSEAILVRPPGVGGDTSTSRCSVPAFSTTFGATFSKLGFDAVKNWGLNWWGRQTGFGFSQGEKKIIRLPV